MGGLTKNRKQENGNILVLVLILMSTLAAFWMIALTSTGSELSLVGGRKSATQQFFNAESGIADTLKDMDAFRAGILDIDPSNPDDNYQPDPQPGHADVTVWRIQSAATPTPPLPTRCIPPAGAEADAEIECYAVRSVSGGKQVEVGVNLQLFNR